MMMNEQIRDLPGFFRRDDFSKIKKYREQLYAETETLSFQELINTKMTESGFTRERLVMSLGYAGTDTVRKKTEIMKKTINTVGYTTNRDRIIAICIALSMTWSEANTALHLYGMLQLDEYDVRDSIIIAALFEGEDYLTTNQWLIKANQLPLSIEKTVPNNIPRVIHVPKDNYSIIKNPTAICGDFVGDHSLSGLYNPNTYACRVEMKIQASDGSTYDLSAEDNGIYEINHHYTNGRTEYKMLRSLNDCMNNEFKDYFLLLEDAVRKKTQNVLSILNDTRNYIARVDASFTDNSLLLFCETFNYDDPEISEYYQMTYRDGIYEMSVSSYSVFLERHLGSNYYSFYSKSERESPRVLVLPNESDKNLHKNGSDNSGKLLKHYTRLKEIIDDTILNMKERKVVVYDPHVIFDDLYYELTAMYGLKEDFTWTEDESGYHLPADREVCDITASDGNNFKLTLSDLLRAFELAIPSVDSICNVILKHGSIDNMVK